MTELPSFVRRGVLKLVDLNRLFVILRLDRRIQEVTNVLDSAVKPQNDRLKQTAL
jgi:hypothetical protein